MAGLSKTVMINKEFAITVPDVQIERRERSLGLPRLEIMMQFAKVAKLDWIRAEFGRRIYHFFATGSLAGLASIYWPGAEQTMVIWQDAAEAGLEWYFTKEDAEEKSSILQRRRKSLRGMSVVCDEEGRLSSFDPRGTWDDTGLFEMAPITATVK